MRGGLEGLAEPDLLRGFCKRSRASGIPITRAVVVIDTLHPVHEGHVVRWRSDEPRESPVREYGRTSQGGEAAESWRRSPFFHMMENGIALIRRRFAAPQIGETPHFPIYEELRADGLTDCLYVVERFASAIGEMDGIYMTLSTDEPGGFTDAQVEALGRTTLSLGLAVKSATLGRIAETLVETYLGRDAGRRVLAGRIERGVADRINAVLWFSDLRGYTRITDTAAPEEIIPLLNGYAEAVISSIEESGGDVLKLIGDGTLAVFHDDDLGQACACALRAEALMRARVEALNAERETAGLPVTHAYLGLNVGEVFYGNIGSQTRLDFTVVGPAVNETSRVATLCRSVEREVLVSSAFAEAARPADRARLVSVGRYMLRGVGRPQDLYTLEPGSEVGVKG